MRRGEGAEDGAEGPQAPLRVASDHTSSYVAQKPGSRQHPPTLPSALIFTLSLGSRPLWHRLSAATTPGLLDVRRDLGHLNSLRV